MARESLFDLVPIPAENSHLMRGDATDLNDAGREYGLLLQEVGSLDLILLGMGDDGHTASLFPHSPQLQETKHRCVATPVSPTEPHLPRLTMTFPFINSARNVLVLVTGKSKAESIAQVLPLVKSSTRNVEELPITNVQPESGTLTWLLDEAAASSISA
jgi:6-phosphogluconolactonase